MKLASITAVLALPVNVLMVIPSILLWLTNGTDYEFKLASISQMIFWVGFLAGVLGLLLLVWTVLDFDRIGQGTLAPWSPTNKLIIKGPYRHVRNPMITGVFLALVAEELILKSIPIAIWSFIFIILNAIYIPYSEESGLEERFGEEYKTYKQNVPRWIPRIMPWPDT